MIKGLNYLLILFCLLLFSAGYPQDSQQKTWLLMMPQSSRNYIDILHVNQAGEISTTGQSLWMGKIYGESADNHLMYPTNQRFIWVYINDSTWKGLRQYEIQSDGILHETGRYYEGDCYGDSISSTPDQSLLFVTGRNLTPFIFKTYPDGSIETTINYSDCLVTSLYMSPRGDFVFSKKTTHPWSFMLAKINYQKPSLTLLNNYDITEPLQVQPNVVFTPDGKNLVLIVDYSKIYIYQINNDGYLDESTVTKFNNVKVAESIVITPNGRHIYGGYCDSNSALTRLDWSDESSRFYYWGCYSTNQVQNMVVSPDGKILIVAMQRDYPTQWFIKTFYIHTDGSLEETGNIFEYSKICNNDIPVNPKMVIFSIPDPTSIPTELWGNWGE